MCFFKLAPWLAEQLQCVHFCDLAPVWIREGVFKSIFWLKYLLHLLFWSEAWLLLGRCWSDLLRQVAGSVRSGKLPDQSGPATCRTGKCCYSKFSCIAMYVDGEVQERSDFEVMVAFNKNYTNTPVHWGLHISIIGEVAAAVEVGSVRWGHLYTGNVKNLLAVRKYAGGVISGLHIF